MKWRVEQLFTPEPYTEESMHELESVVERLRGAEAFLAANGRVKASVNKLAISVEVESESTDPGRAQTEGAVLIMELLDGAGHNWTRRTLMNTSVYPKSR